jgi:tRNA (guanine26-N2/guanine27-N2)-dimethyltransferase
MASMLMYQHRHPAKRVEVVDLDPYGTAAPFIDGAVQCVTDGGQSIIYRVQISTDIQVS